jgi:potassium efflux system protein
MTIAPRRRGIPGSRLLASIVACLAIWLAGAFVPTGAQMLPIAPKQETTAAPPATELAPEPEPGSGSALTRRILALRGMLGADLGLSVDRREAFEGALVQLLGISRRLDDAQARLDAARTRRDAPESNLRAVDVDVEFDRWRKRQTDAAAPLEFWTRISSLVDEVRALRRREEDLLSLGSEDARAGAESDPELAAPVTSSLVLPADASQSIHARAIVELAQELEARRIEVATAIAGERRSGMLDRLQRVGAERVAITGRLALAERKLGFLGESLRRSLDSLLGLVRTQAQRKLATPGLDEDVRADTEEVLRLADTIERLMDQAEARQRKALDNEQQLADVVRVSAGARARLAAAGSSAAVGLVLIADLARTIAPARIAADLATVRRELAAARLQLVDVRARLLDTRAEGSNLSAEEFTALLSGSGPVPDSAVATTRFRQLLVVDAGSVALIDILSGDEATLVELDRRNSEVRNLIGTRALWTRTHDAIDADWFRALATRIASGEMGSGTRAAVREAGAKALGTGARLAWLLTGLGLLAIAWRWLWRMRARLLDSIRNSTAPALSQDVTTIAMTLMLAIPLAVAVGLVFRVARGLDEPSGFYGSVVHASLPAFWTALTLVGLMLLGTRDGPGSVVLGWSDATRRGVRRAALGLILVLMPTLVVLSAWYRGDLVALEYEARLLFILAWLGVAWVFWRTLGPAGLRFSISASAPSLTRRALRLALTGTAVAASGAAAVGYQIGAIAVASELEGTITVLSVLLIAHGLAMRAIAAGERRAWEWRAVTASLAQRERPREAAVAASAAGTAHELREVSADSRAMVDFAFAVGGAVWLAAQWSDLVPALLGLDDVALWEVTAEGGRKESVSLLDLLLALVTGTLLVVGLRRLPGLADLFLRQRGVSDTGSRFAVTALLRYAIAVVGVIATLGLIGVRWSQLQWLAAALTVGLGFGLQEIFANFVSGLILLFERPVRVGDVVSIGEVSGTVTNIGTRATALMDFERREVLIPNRLLITGSLTNWTLSTEVTRVTIKVGVGYGTEPALAHRLLQRAAAEVALVLKEPAPVSAFVGFGASNLDFELRAFVARIDDRVAVASELHAKVLALLGAAGVPIDYDQLEVRLVGKDGGAVPSAAEPAAGPASA